MKKIPIISVVLLLLLSTIFPIISSNETSHNIIYVDDDGGVDYTKIQDAIDNASNGDTVFVYNGTYYESIVIDKSIDLIGENKDNSIIRVENKSSHNIVNIISDNVTISEFTLKTENDFVRGILLSGSEEHLLSNININNNRIIRPKYGDSISINWANNINISYNILYGCFGTGYCVNIMIYSNEIRGNLITCIMSINTNLKSNNIYINNSPLIKPYYIILQPSMVLKNPQYNLKFEGNYYGKSYLLPKPIIYLLGYPVPNTHPQLEIIFPLIFFDWHPAQKPYDI